MFDIGGMELLLIGIAALIVIGPKDLPGMFHTVGKFMGKARGMAREFQRSMEEAADESGLKDAASGLGDIRDLGRSPLKATARKYADDLVAPRETPKNSESAAAKASAAISPKKPAAPAKPAAPKKPAAPMKTAAPKKPARAKKPKPKPATKPVKAAAVKKSGGPDA